MKASISWLTDYTKINLSTKDLMWRMTEAGMTTESYQIIENEKVLDVEITPNRPDWLSIIGLAREIAVIQKINLKYPKLLDIPEKTANLPIKIHVDKSLTGRYTGLTIADVKVAPSPKWMQKRLKLVGLRPINNLVDITNYVMFELGVPIHVFDYDKFQKKELTMQLTNGNEKFSSVDEIEYTLPKGCLVIKDNERVIDLCGIKGGLNTGISTLTKNVFIHVPIYDPLLIRKTSQKLGLASDASYIYERGADAGSTMSSLKRCVEYVIKYAGGKVASKVMDTRKQSDYKPRKLVTNLNRVNDLIGVVIEKDKILSILKNLQLDPTISGEKLSCNIPSFRDDLKIDEDIIEEVARIYGYNNFPKTIPFGKVSIKKIPYYYNRDFELEIKNILVKLGYLEVNTQSLTSKEIIEKSNLDPENHIRIINPVSLEYEFMRTTLIPNLLDAVNLNSLDKKLMLFEYNKVHFPPVDKSKEEYMLSAIFKGGSYRQIKNILDTLLKELNIFEVDYKQTIVEKGLWHPIKSGVIEKGIYQLGTIGEINPFVLDKYGLSNDIFALEINVEILKSLSKQKYYKPVPKFPGQVEDVTLVLPDRVKVQEIIHLIKSVSTVINRVELVDIFDNKFSFRIHYQHEKKTISSIEVKVVRKKILKALKEKWGISSD
jgi:phenylalanyl-tRNA synthetase beta chain